MLPFRCRTSRAPSSGTPRRSTAAVPHQHSGHIAFVHPEAEKFGPLKPHRDGTRSVYVKDPAGNPVEILAQD